jgi:hypothetical protein
MALLSQPWNLGITGIKLERENDPTNNCSPEIMRADRDCSLLINPEKSLQPAVSAMHIQCFSQT